MSFHRLVRYAALGVALALPACNDSPSEPEETGGNVVGSWVLVTLNGQAIPASQSVIHPEYGNCTFTFEAMRMDFAADLTYSGSTTSSLACTGRPAEPVNEEFGGTYRTEGNQLLTMPDEFGGQEFVATYTVTGDTFRMRETGVVYLFERSET